MNWRGSDPQQMTKRAAQVRRLQYLRNTKDPEAAHVEADRILLDIISDPDVSDAFQLIPKWYG